MKQFFLTIAIVVVATMTMSAQNSYKNIINRFSSADGVEKVKIGSFLMGICHLCMDNDDEDAQIMKGIKDVSVLDFSKSPEKTRAEFRKEVSKMDTKDMELLMEISDNSDLLKIYVKKSGEDISQFLMVNTGEKPCIVNISGKISKDSINKLVAENR